jgi:aspartate kinase
MALVNPIVVMKFGGTSVANAPAIQRVVDIVGGAQAAGRTPVVVVSAMAGVTDTLLALARDAAAGEKASVLRRVDELQGRHAAAASDLAGPAGCGALLEAIARQCDELRAVLTALCILREASPRSLDGIAATGELLNSRIVAAALAEAGVESRWIDARRAVVTDSWHTGAFPQAGPTRDAVQRELVPAVAAHAVPVLGGYVGATGDGVTTTLGRGGSDYSAAVVGAAIHDALAAGSESPAGIEIQIWTDVDGMLTADPRIIDDPRVVPELSFGEASELAYFGAKVLHPSTILPAIERDIPVRILNSRRPALPGTLITSRGAAGPRPIAAIACKRSITVIEVTSTRMLMAHGFLRRLFEVFERFRTPVDVVTTSEVSVSVTVDDDHNVEAIAGALREFAEVTIERGMAILCAVGDRLRIDPALGVRLLGSLEGFALRMVSQAASRRNLTVVLQERDLAAAMARLHHIWLAAPIGASRTGGTRLCEAAPIDADRPDGTQIDADPSKGTRIPADLHRSDGSHPRSAAQVAESDQL